MITGIRNKNLIPFLVFTILFALCAGVSVITELYYLTAIPFALVLFYAGWQSAGLVFLFLLFSLPFSFEYMVTENLATDIPDELLMVGTSFLFLSYWIYHPHAITKQVLHHPLIIILLTGLGWAVLCAVFSTYPVLSTKYLLAKAWYLGAFVLAALIGFRKRQMVLRASAILVSAILIVTIIILIRHSRYNFSFAGINNAVTPFFRNHVTYSAMMVCMIPVVFVYWKTALSAKRKRAMTAILIVLLAALILSYSRGAWLALFSGIATAWLLKRRRLLITYFAVIILALSSLFLLKSGNRYLRYAHDYRTTIWHADFREHLTATYQIKDVSTAERFYRWIAGVRMIKDNWLTGYGPNSFYHNYKPYTISAFKTWVSQNEERSTVHNYFLLIAIEQGIPGLALFLLLVGAMLYYAQYLYHHARSTFHKRIAMIAGVILVMILTLNFLSDLIETDKIGSIFYLCLSLLVVTDIADRNMKMES